MKITQFVKFAIAALAIASIMLTSAPMNLSAVKNIVPISGSEYEFSSEDQLSNSWMCWRDKKTGKRICMVLV